MTREEIGRLVRQVWVDYCKETGRIEKPSHVVPWEDLDDWDREIDRRIGEALYKAGRTDELRTRLATYIHEEQWRGWVDWMLSKGTTNAEGSVTLSAEWVTRWTRQMNTAFEDLSPREQHSDISEANKILEVFKGWIVDAL